MIQPNENREPDKTDYLIAWAIGAVALAVYVRTLAPDVLYGDSAEFQTLAYTLGMTHSTGYPIYLLLARLVGVVPIGSLAWRVNLLSAIGAAATLSGVYLLIRHQTRSRVGAVLGSVALGQSYTFWSQAIIAEVYTLGLAFLVASLVLLQHWHSSRLERNRSLLAAALLAGLGLGVHAFVGLIAPAATAFVAWPLWARRIAAPQWRRSLLAASAGLTLGVSIFLLAFMLIDLNDPPSSFYRVMLYPSRSIWGLESTDMDSPVERLYLTVTGRQWQDAMFTAGVDEIGEEFKKYGERLWSAEFSAAMLALALFGLIVMLRAARQWGGFMLTAFLTMLFFILNYEPPDKHIFYLPTYLLVAIALGTGIGFLLEMAYRYLATLRQWRSLVLYPLAVALFILAVIKPYWAAGWEALRAGAATFVQEHYPYPLYDLDEPRSLATVTLLEMPDNALLVMGWRELYATLYLAHVEHESPGITILEATPHGGNGKVADTLLQEINDALDQGRPVYADAAYDDLKAHFRVRPAGSHWYQVFRK